jgi:ABC-2 type transport system ATP-binding protein
MKPISDIALQVTELSKTFGSFAAVDRLTLSVQKGTIFGFLGPNGAGKTTTIRMVLGLLVPSAGSVSVFGIPCHEQPLKVKSLIGYVPDQPTFHDFLRAREILMFVAEMHGLPRGEARSRTDRLLAWLDLSAAGDDFAVNYSQGMKKKLALGCALIHEPPLLILDEPTNGLDPAGSRAFEELVRGFAATGRTVFVSTHLLDMVERVCTEIGIIAQGRLRAIGSARDIVHQFARGGRLEDAFLRIANTSKGTA